MLRDQQSNVITVQDGKRIVLAQFTVPLEVRQSRRNQPMPQSA
ncbi:Transposase (plasmid) [Mycetohabitans rhizoxinica HKI 454]|uniref:Transposase n=1 Tax=Mycetohabitans rhizoxinica (strain DSM 19002 / CIP 109453 / HKI 454) TaxID=882378 RepID=E5AUD2_MYCRK|nr:Transposase [Mycetohabitans rhizoxinica HKI 454]